MTCVTRSTRLSICSWVLAGAMISLASAAGGVAYAPNSLTADPTGPDMLVMFDPQSPSGYTVVGSMGADNIGFGGLDFDDQGNLWAYASFYKSTGGAASGLYLVDVETGLATAVGFNFQTLQDIAFNPSDGKLYGVNTRQGSMTKLYEINRQTGLVEDLGLVTGLPASHQINGLAIDSQGNFYFQDLTNDVIHASSGVGGVCSELYQLSIDTNYSQGMTIDWSRDDKGYHAAVGQGVFPNYFSTINPFSTDGSSYSVGGEFGPNDQSGLPPVQPGDIAIIPAASCPADITGDGNLNFFDVSGFLEAFSSSDPIADFSGDGSFNFFDVSAFLSAFGEGCP